MLLQKSMLRISYRNRNLCQEVYNMTEPVLKLPTDELFEVIHERDALKRACSKRIPRLLTGMPDLLTRMPNLLTRTPNLLNIDADTVICK